MHRLTTAFDLSQDFLIGCQAMGIDGVLRGQYGLLNEQGLMKENVVLLRPDGQCHKIAQNMCLFTPDNSIYTQGIYAIKLCYTKQQKRAPFFSEVYTQFVLSLLQAEYAIFKQFFHATHDYLQHRVAFGKALTQHDSMRVVLSEIVENSVLLQRYSECTDMPSLRLFSDVLLRTTKQVANCTGGRSFVSGQILAFYYSTYGVNHFLCY